MNEDEWFLDDPDDDDFERKQNRKKNRPIYQKAIDISKTARLLGSTLKGRDKEMYEFHLNESALIITAKIAGAIGSRSWLISMQNAAIVRSHAEWMLTATSGLKHMTKADKNYVRVLREEMEEFRELFKELVGNIHKMDKDDFDDEWGLFLRE